MCRCGNGYRSLLWRNMSECEACGGDYLEQDYYSGLDQLVRAYRETLPGYKTTFIGQVDHIVPRWYGLKNRISVYELGSIDNLQFISVQDNADFRNPYQKGGWPPEHWFALITSVKWVYWYNGLKSTSLARLCEEVGVSYVQAASQLIKLAASEIVVDGAIIRRVHPNDLNVTFGW